VLNNNISDPPIDIIYRTITLPHHKKRGEGIYLIIFFLEKIDQVETQGIQPNLSPKKNRTNNDEFLNR
jgi:hypothetical protein